MAKPLDIGIRAVYFDEASDDDYTVHQVGNHLVGVNKMWSYLSRLAVAVTGPIYELEWPAAAPSHPGSQG
jgi:hypothetical protein